MVDATTVSGTRPSLRRKMLSSFQEGAMHEALFQASVVFHRFIATALFRMAKG